MENSPTNLHFTYSKLVWKETRAVDIQVYTQFQYARNEPYDHLHEPPTPPIEQKVIYVLRRYGLTVQGENLEELTQRLLSRAERRQLIDTTVLSFQSGLELGFDESCLLQFCKDNELDSTQSITRTALRAVVLERRAINFKKYRVGLRLVGILIQSRLIF